MWIIAFVLWAMMAEPVVERAEQVPTLIPIGYEFPQREVEELAKEEWVGLFEDATTSRLVPVRLLAGEKVILITGDPGYVVESEPGGSRWAIPAGLLKPGPVVRSASEFPSLPHGTRSVAIALAKRSYTLRVEGFVGADARRHSVTLREGDREQALFDTPWIDEGYVDIRWAGDLDGDGRLDLITNITPKYSKVVYTLWLSSKAGEGELVGIAARIEYYGC